MPSQSTIVEPKLACRAGKKEDPIEVSLHTLPKPLLREFQHVFQEKYLSGDDYMMTTTMIDPSSSSQTPPELLALPTNQQARHDLVAVGDEIEEEKDRLLNCVRCIGLPIEFTSWTIDGFEATFFFFLFGPIFSHR
jgi:hypothetical protein